MTDLFSLCANQSRLDIDAGIFNPGGSLPVNLGQFQAGTNQVFPN
jgi:hypothetical protein